MLKEFSIALALATTAFASPGWITTWSCGVSEPYTDPTQLASAHLVFSNQTLREIVHVSVGSDMVRVRLSNIYGASAVEFGEVHLAEQTSASSIDPTTDRTLTFSGQTDVIIPPNADLLSDPIPFNVQPATNLVISLYIPGSANGASIQYSANQTSYLGAGDQAGAASITKSTSVSFWSFLAGVDVTSTDPASGTVVAFGDSITNGYQSTANANHRWSDYLAARMLTAGIESTGVANAGINGNRILHNGSSSIANGDNALSRLGHSVLDVPNAKYVIILLGVNDIGQPGSTSAPASEAVTSDQVIAGLEQLANRAHERGLKVYGCTIMPFAVYPTVGWYTPDKDAERQAVNTWIRSGVAYDAVIDFDLAMRDPANPAQLLPAYDSGDHLHPNDLGYSVMADAIDLSLFRVESGYR